MIRPRLYLDTSVPSAFFDDRASDRQRLTRRFWREQLPAYDPVVSELVLEEIAQTPDPQRRAEILRLVESFEILADLGAATEDLTAEYIARGIFSSKTAGDALHVAIAVTHGIGYLGSWNFRHLVRVATRREVSLVNALNGYQPLEIVAPPEL
jgi:predicted nucleic acid-binding protein